MSDQATHDAGMILTAVRLLMQRSERLRQEQKAKKAQRREQITECESRLAAAMESSGNTVEILDEIRECYVEADRLRELAKEENEIMRERIDANDASCRALVLDEVSAQQTIDLGGLELPDAVREAAQEVVALGGEIDPALESAIA